MTYEQTWAECTERTETLEGPKAEPHPTLHTVLGAQREPASDPFCLNEHLLVLGQEGAVALGPTKGTTPRTLGHPPCSTPRPGGFPPTWGSLDWPHIVLVPCLEDSGPQIFCSRSLLGHLPASPGLRALRRLGGEQDPQSGGGAKAECVRAKGRGGIHLIITAIKITMADKNGAFVCQVLCQAFYVDSLVV